MLEQQRTTAIILTAPAIARPRRRPLRTTCKFDTAHAKPKNNHTLRTVPPKRSRACTYAQTHTSPVRSRSTTPTRRGLASSAIIHTPSATAPQHPHGHKSGASHATHIRNTGIAHAARRAQRALPLPRLHNECDSNKHTLATTARAEIQTNTLSSRPAAGQRLTRPAAGNIPHAPPSSPHETLRYLKKSAGRPGPTLPCYLCPLRARMHATRMHRPSPSPARPMCASASTVSDP